MEKCVKRIKDGGIFSRGGGALKRPDQHWRQATSG